MVEDLCRDPVFFAMEDVLRLLREHGGSASIDIVSRDVGEKELVEKALRILVERGMVRLRNGVVELTDKGFREADNVYRRHVAAEQLLEGITSDPHRAAHFIEHAPLEPEVLRKVVRGRVCSLYALPVGIEARVIAYIDPKPSITSRLYGVGIIPGRRIRVRAKLYGSIIVEVGLDARMVAIDATLAKKILVVVKG